MSEQPNFTPETSQLLAFAGRVASAIRMNSPYNGTYRQQNPEHGQDVMWLADSLHTFECLGKAIAASDLPRIEAVCNALIRQYDMYCRDDTGYKSEPLPTFEKQTLFTVAEGRSILRSIRDKAASYQNTREHGDR